MENENEKPTQDENPLGLALDDNGIMTDINELRDVTHGFAKQMAMFLGEHPILSMLLGPEYEMLVNVAVSLHNWTCPERLGKKAWTDIEQRAKAYIESKTQPEQKPEEPKVELSETIESVLREIEF